MYDTIIVGSSIPAADLARYQRKDVNGSVTVEFELAEGQVAPIQASILEVISRLAANAIAEGIAVTLLQKSSIGVQSLRLEEATVAI